MYISLLGEDFGKFQWDFGKSWYPNEPDRKKLYEFINMSLDASEGLLNKVQFDIRLYFCRRSQDKTHGMNKSTFEVLNDPKTGLN